MTRLIALPLTIDLDSNANLAAIQAALAPYYTLTPVASTTPIAPPAQPNKLLVVCAQNGKPNAAWNQDYSYSAKATLNAPGDGNGNPNGILVVTNGSWGAYQPSNTAPATTDFSACSRLTVDIYAPKGNSYSMQFLMGGDLPIASPGFQFTKTTDGWETFSCPKAQLMTDAVKGDVSKIIYKGAIQSKQAAAGDTFRIDNWGGI